VGSRVGGAKAPSRPNTKRAVRTRLASNAAPLAPTPLPTDERQAGVCCSLCRCYCCYCCYCCGCWQAAAAAAAAASSSIKQQPQQQAAAASSSKQQQQQAAASNNSNQQPQQQQAGAGAATGVRRARTRCCGAARCAPRAAPLLRRAQPSLGWCGAPLAGVRGSVRACVCACVGVPVRVGGEGKHSAAGCLCRCYCCLLLVVLLLLAARTAPSRLRPSDSRRTDVLGQQRRRGHPATQSAPTQAPARGRSDAQQRAGRCGA